MRSNNSLVSHTMKALSLYLISYLLLQPTQFIFAEGNSLSIKLIHRDSIESPLYPGDLIHEERIDRIIRQSNDHSNHMMNTRNQSVDTYHLDHIGSNIHYDGVFYLAVVGIGTFEQVPRYKAYYLMLNTGSSLVWVQCQGCAEAGCFHQAQPYYPYGESSTYRPITCSDSEHDVCGVAGHCRGKICTYDLHYKEDAMSSGYLAREAFTFPSDTREEETVDLVMGCGIKQTGFIFPENTQIAGFLGIGNSPSSSFIRQLGNRAQNRFTHCLQPWRHGQVMPSFLRFGDDAEFRPNQQIHTTRLLFNNKHPHYYYLELHDISIAGTRLNFPPNIFRFRKDGSGGCVIDTGIATTRMVRRQYDRVMSEFETVFSGLRRMTVGGFDLCYYKPTEDYILPSMVFHFLSADYEVLPEQLFWQFKNTFCVLIQAHTVDTLPLIIGNHMQINYKIMYDLSSMMLSFSRVECDRSE